MNATSYIPTSGSTVTRNQDIISRDGIGSLVNSEEGVVFLEMAALINGGSYRSISLSDGTNTNVLEIDLAPTSNRLEVYFIINGVSYLSPNSYSIVQTDYNKIAFSWEENNLKLYVNGIELVNDLTATLLPNKFNRLKFSASNGSLPFNGKVKQLQVYTTALTDSQLTALTS